MDEIVRWVLWDRGCWWVLWGEGI